MRIMMWVLPALALAGALALTGTAEAQQRDRRCAPNYPELCYKACVERGGQARTCPAYCQQQQREAKCG